MVIDDFTVDASELQITHVSGLFGAQAGFASFQAVSSYQLSVFSAAGKAAANLSGDVISLLVIAGSGASVTQVNGGDHGLVSLNVNLILPKAGTYWVGISPKSTNTENFFYVQNSGAQGTITPGNHDGQFANPGNGIKNEDLSVMNVDYAYSITVVPEPSAITLWIAGGCALLCRRRRARHASHHA